MTPKVTSRSPIINLRFTGKHFRTITITASCLLLTACSAVGPDYQIPTQDYVNNKWSLLSTDSTKNADLSHWWFELNDPILNRLITTALAQNLNLQQAEAKIDEARALRDRVSGERLPKAGANTSINRQKQSSNGPLPIDSMPSLNTTQTIYDAGFDASWELDLFGAKQRSLESAQAHLQRAEAEARGVRIRIISEVARTWFNVIGAENELRAQKSILDALKQVLDLTRLRHAQGDLSATDVDIAYIEWATANSEIPNIQAKQRAAVLSLSVLLGNPPEKELSLLDGPMNYPNLRMLPIGERADVLRRRPDIIAAERNLAANTADIGVATAELFPKLSIGINGGFQALSTGNWFDSSSSNFTVLPLISWRLFDGGRVRAEIRANEAKTKQAALAYEQTVLSALEDAEESLSNYNASIATLTRRSAALDASRVSYQRTRTRYAVGDIALFDLLAIQRNHFELEKSYARSNLDTAVQMVALYKALGGGWNTHMDAPSNIN